MVNITHLGITVLNDGFSSYPLSSFLYTDQSTSLSFSDETIVVQFVPYKPIQPLQSGTAIRFSYTSSATSSFLIPSHSYYVIIPLNGSAGLDPYVEFSLCTGPEQSNEILTYRSVRNDNAQDSTSINDLIIYPSSKIHLNFP